MATSSNDRGRVWRSRWAALGAAVAVTLGGGGVFFASAASSEPSSVITVDPVRILDTRDSNDIGLPGPFVSMVSQNLQVTGSVVPAGATGVLLNATVVNPSADGFVSIRPGDASGLPSTSSLNFTAGETVPNSVQVGLPVSGDEAGQIDITFDAYGEAGPTTDLLLDVVGYLIPATGGADGPVGPPGADGPAGPPGADGPAGPMGEPGASYLVSAGQAPFPTGSDTVGVRFKSTSTSGEVYLGVNDLGTGANRVEANTTWPDGLRPFSFAFDGSELSAATPGATGVTAVALTRPASTCAAPDLLQMRLRAQGTGGGMPLDTVTAVENLAVNGVPLGDFGPATFDADDYFANDLYVTITGDLSGEFSISGLIDTTNWSGGNERNQVELTVGCST